MQELALLSTMWVTGSQSLRFGSRYLSYFAGAHDFFIIILFLFCVCMSVIV